MKKLSIIAMTLIMVLGMVGCGPSQEAEKKYDKSIHIYCGAGMKKPFLEMAKIYEEEAKVTVDVTVGNAAEIKNQIVESEDGDIWIAGGESELKSLKEKDMIGEVISLVKHVPVVAVSTDSNVKIESPQDLANSDINVVTGDAGATPIGKIANKFFEKQGIKDKVNIVANTCSSPAMIEALQTSEANVAIMFKENAIDKEGVDILDMPEINDHIMKVQAVGLSTSKNVEETADFMKWIVTEKPKEIWAKYGYEALDE